MCPCVQVYKDISIDIYIEKERRSAFGRGAACNALSPDRAINYTIPPLLLSNHNYFSPYKETQMCPKFWTHGHISP